MSRGSWIGLFVFMLSTCLADCSQNARLNKAEKRLDACESALRDVTGGAR